MHTPVLLNEVLEYLGPRKGDFIIDGTVDGGGHAEAIIAKIGSTGKFLGLDWDERLLAECRARLGSEKNIFLEHGNYADLPEILVKRKMENADGLLIDLGFSSEQLENSGRGFSFSEAAQDEPLLMTYDDSRTPVKDIIRGMTESELADIIFEFGGERGSRRIAKAIKEAGKREPIVTSGQLAKVVRESLPGNYEHGRIDAATRTFQAFRIYANGELDNLKTLLGSVRNILKPGGRVAIVSFHSTEDGIIKKAFQTFAKEGTIAILTKKPISASFEEIKNNPRSRSAKLRAAQLI